jgi:hypothetical protein
MKKLVLLLVAASILAAGCFMVGPKGELRPLPVVLIGKFHEDAKAK